MPTSLKLLWNNKLIISHRLKKMIINDIAHGIFLNIGYLFLKLIYKFSTNNLTRYTVDNIIFVIKNFFLNRLFIKVYCV